jgi:hypothetical protein
MRRSVARSGAMYEQRPPLLSDGLCLRRAVLQPSGGAGIRTLVLGGALWPSTDATCVEAVFIMFGQACATDMLPSANARARAAARYR